MKKTFILLLLFSCSLAFADEKDSTLNMWIPKGIAGLNISQIAFSDWSQGGDNSITYSVTGNFGLDYRSEKWAFVNSLKLTYGQTKIADENFKTNENEFYLENVYSRKIGWEVDPYISNTVRTILAPGYKYNDSGRTKIAAFFDPGYLSQSLGFAYDKLDEVKTRLGIALQETFTSDFPNYSDDPDTPDELETFKLETGIESVTDIQHEFLENMLYKSKLRLFTRFDRLDVWDVRWDNTVAAKINKWFVVNLNVLIVYERNQSLRTQIKEALQLGVTFNLF